MKQNGAHHLVLPLEEASLTSRIYRASVAQPASLVAQVAAVKEVMILMVVQEF